MFIGKPLYISILKKNNGDSPSLKIDAIKKIKKIKNKGMLALKL